MGGGGDNVGPAASMAAFCHRASDRYPAATSRHTCRFGGRHIRRNDRDGIEPAVHRPGAPWGGGMSSRFLWVPLLSPASLGRLNTAAQAQDLAYVSAFADNNSVPVIATATNMVTATATIPAGKFIGPIQRGVLGGGRPASSRGRWFRAPGRSRSFRRRLAWAHRPSGPSL